MTILFQKTMPLSIPNYRSLTPPIYIMAQVETRLPLLLSHPIHKRDITLLRLTPFLMSGSGGINKLKAGVAGGLKT